MVERSALSSELSRVRDAENFEALFEKVEVVLRGAKDKSPDGRVGYVSGIISSDGPEFLERNRRTLQEKTEKFRELYDFPIFSANDIFTPEFVDRLGHKDAPYVFFWRRVLATGLVTDIFMTTGWERSRGASDEHLTANLLELDVVYEQEVIKHKPPTGYGLQDRIRELFLPWGMEVVEGSNGKFWIRTLIGLEGGGKISLSNGSDSTLAVRAERSDFIFQFGLNEKGLSWIEGVCKASEEEVREVYDPEEIYEGEEERIYISEFFSDRLGSLDTLFSTDRVFNGQREVRHLFGDLYYWIRDALKNEEIPDLPESAKKYIKPKSWTRLRL